ncbi:glycosyltransferase [Micromonospora sp. CPCC 205371]|nr:glycosyltransferase [Micromonospora sp. CPCC 205371]
MPKIVVYPADETGCGRFRLIWPAQVLRAQGHDVTIVWPSKRSGIGGALDEHGTAVEAYAPPGTDVVVLQRLSYRPIATAVPLLRAQGIAVVVDMDDDLSCIHPSNPAHRMYDPPPGLGSLHSWRHAADACRDATLVTTASEALQQVYAAHGRGAVLSNCVPRRYLSIERQDSDVIGWGGTMRSHPDDLQTVGVAVARLMQDGHRFRVIGPRDGVKEALRLPAEPEATGSVPIESWPDALSTLGVGIAPLADTKFNISKSFLKIVEYSGLGVPWVASPRAEYKRFHTLGPAGMLADSPRQWVARLRELVTNDGLRREMSEAGRALAAQHTIEGNAWRWLDVWTRAAQMERNAYRSATGGPVRQRIPAAVAAPPRPGGGV